MNHPVDIVCTDEGAVGVDLDHIYGILSAGRGQLRWDYALLWGDRGLPVRGAPNIALGVESFTHVLVVPEIDQDVLCSYSMCSEFS